MKRLLFLVAVLFAAMLISMPASTSTSAAEGATKQRIGSQIRPARYIDGFHLER